MRCKQLSCHNGRFRAAAALAILASSVPAAFSDEAVVFYESFESGTSAASWQVYSHAGDFTADFFYDYATTGIPLAPNSAPGGGHALCFTVNNNDTDPAADAVSAYPDGVVLGDDRTLRFDMWINYNGGPGGGSGSTEFATFGIGHAGGTVVWTNNAASDGAWFAVTGEGGAADDYRAYDGSTLLSITAGGYAAGDRNHTAPFYQTLFPTPPYQTTGVPGKRWVEVEVSRRRDVLEWRINDMLIALRPAGGLPAGDIMLGYMDIYSSLANPAEDNFVLFDNVRVVAPDCDANGVADDLDIAAEPASDCNENGIPDACQTVALADFDVDGDVDPADFANLLPAFGGPGVDPATLDPTCAPLRLAAFDADNDGAIDLRDWALVQQMLTIRPFPPRAANAPTGSQFYAEVASMTWQNREARIMAEITGGNVPGFLRAFVPVDVSGTVGGAPVSATISVTCDYMCIGRDDDFARVPMTPLVAQPLADAFDCLLPTRKMVDAIYAQAEVKLAPSPISPDTVDITLPTTMYRHHQKVESQRAGRRLGALIGGIKKDVVITPRLATNPNRVAIYGWHLLSGSPIQPLYLGHVDWYVDYSHGIRLVSNNMLVNGEAKTVQEVLAHPTLHVLLSDEGAVTNPRY